MVKATCLDISFCSGEVWTIIEKPDTCMSIFDKVAILVGNTYTYIYDVITTILNVVDFQLKNGHIYKVS